MKSEIKIAISEATEHAHNIPCVSCGIEMTAWKIEPNPICFDCHSYNVLTPYTLKG